MPGAWDERPLAEDGYVHDTPLGADGAEELAHELALAAALDRSRPSLSPDAAASDRMRQRLFEAMAEQEFGTAAPAAGPAELTGPLGAPAATDPHDALDADGPMTRPFGPPVPDVEPDVTGASIARAAGEHTLRTPDAGDGDARGRRPRHVLPTDHPDHPEAESAGSGPGRRSAERARPPRGAGASGRRRPSLRRRFGVLVTAVAALAVLAGVAATASKDSLPGDTLYGVKRVTESTGGVFTFDDEAEANRQLEIARTRMDEVHGLLQRGAAPDSAAITSTMDEFDTATSNGSRAILSADRGAGTPDAADATGTPDASPAPAAADAADLADLRTWAETQSKRMSEMRPDMPAANSADANDSMALLDRVLGRTEALRANSGCAKDATASVDDLGPMPSGTPCATAGGGPAVVEGEPSTDGDATTDSSEPGTSESTEPGTPTNPTPSGPPTERDGGLLPPLLGGTPPPSGGAESTSPSGTSGTSGTSGSSGTSTSSTERGGGLPPITLPPLLPGLGPVTIG